MNFLSAGLSTERFVRFSDCTGRARTNQNELWSYGPDAQAILTSYDRLRYRLMPYIYSLAWKTTSEAYTPMRALAMDFRTDTRALNVGDQFMFGPALLVNPVTEPSATSRRVYLPKAKWYDFWTGRGVDGGGIDRSGGAAGSDCHCTCAAGRSCRWGRTWSMRRKSLRIPSNCAYIRARTRAFTLYEDENDNYNYEQGARATIRIDWDDAGRRLTIGERRGQFPGMLQARKFRIVFVAENHGVGIEPTTQPDTIVEYSGKAITATR